MKSKMLPYALEYAKHGWHVFPLHCPTNGGCSCGRPCNNTGKHPRTKNGLLDATTDQGVIRRWWNRWPEANIGVRTGAVSGIVVIDIDPEHWGDETLYELESQYGKLPETAEAKTGGGGRHIVFRHPSFNVRSGVGILGEGIDIRADGGYIVAPPSKHASGSIYSWDVTSREKGIAEMPPWLQEMLRGPNLGVPEKVEGNIPRGAEAQHTPQLRRLHAEAGDDGGLHIRPHFRLRTSTGAARRWTTGKSSESPTACRNIPQKTHQRAGRTTAMENNRKGRYQHHAFHPRCSKPRGHLPFRLSKRTDQGQGKPLEGLARRPEGGNSDFKLQKRGREPRSLCQSQPALHKEQEGYLEASSVPGQQR